MVVNLPHNPTGMHLGEAEFDALVELVERHGATLVCDEVYRGLEQDPAARLPAAADRSPRAVSVGVLSKSYALAGLRVGWLATHDRDLLDAVAQVRDYTSLCSPAPSEVLGIIALRARTPCSSVAAASSPPTCRSSTTLFAAHAERIDWVRPWAGSIGFPRYLGDEGIDAFNERLVREQGVLLLPGARLRLWRRALPAGLRAYEPPGGGGTARPPIAGMSAYDRIGATYALTRRPDARIDARSAARSVTRAASSTSGAGAGAYEPRDREVVAVEPSAVMLAQRARARRPGPGPGRGAPRSRTASFDAALAVLTMHHWRTGARGSPSCGASRARAS